MIDNSKNYAFITMAKDNKKKIKIKTDKLNFEIDDIDIVYFDENTFEKANEEIFKRLG